jgi:hypothetical protein
MNGVQVPRHWVVRLGGSPHVRSIGGCRSIVIVAARTRAKTAKSLRPAANISPAVPEAGLNSLYGAIKGLLQGATGQIDLLYLTLG